MIPEKFFLHGIAKVGQNETNLKENRADWITGTELHCTCKMALSMAPQAFISTIDNALYALRLKRADWTGRLDLPSGSRMSAFRAGPASDNTQLSSYRRASNPLCPPKKAKGDSLNCPLRIFGQTGFEPATPSPPDLYAKPLRHCPLLQ